MIEISIDARNFGKRKGASYCVQLSYGTLRWVKSFRAGNITTNQAELKAFEFAFKSIAEQFIETPVKIYTSGRYCSMMLELDGDDWKRIPKSNIGLVDEVRRQYKRFSSVQIELMQLDDLKSMNEDTVINNEEVCVRES